MPVRLLRTVVDKHKAFMHIQSFQSTGPLNAFSTRAGVEKAGPGVDSGPATSPCLWGSRKKPECDPGAATAGRGGVCMTLRRRR
eukprot:506667-Prymnesium_polylepis.1